MSEFIKKNFRILVSDNICSTYVGTDPNCDPGTVICNVHNVYTLDEFCREYYDTIECKISEIKAEKLKKEIKAVCCFRDMNQAQVNAYNVDINIMCDQYFKLTGKPYRSDED